jgi:hypothetical protein
MMKLCHFKKKVGNMGWKQVKSAPNQIGPKSNRPQIKSAPSQIGPIFVVYYYLNILLNSVQTI